MFEPDVGGPLRGVRVVDLSDTFMAPYASLLLAQMGADVVKVELPAGDIADLAGYVAGGEFDLDDLGPHLGQKQAGVGGHERVGEVDDPHTVQWPSDVSAGRVRGRH